ncbi:hypothetical protein SKAU_G00310540 [Synaphobranchus kaupii]|uniref:Uncharacterized protein n=1 Tax=Synaphobranchus kaupii TaxID=118154 RepID=A0A9Q1ERK3_SYNKA|nr:hypothetical protein SKAU_G00310540 [Synaphobranchus kaupii]
MSVRKRRACDWYRDLGTVYCVNNAGGDAPTLRRGQRAEPKDEASPLRQTGTSMTARGAPPRGGLAHRELREGGCKQGISLTRCIGSAGRSRAGPDASQEQTRQQMGPCGVNPSCAAPAFSFQEGRN